MKLTKAIGVSSTALVLVLSASTAQANFKGISINRITEFWFNGITQFIEAETTSGAVAVWGAGNGEMNFDRLDPEVADCGPSGCDVSLPENAFRQLVDVPPAPQVNWARGDAQIINPNVLIGEGAASNVAEVYSAPGVETPYPVLAEGNNTLEGSFLGTGDDITFSFLADPFIEVWVSPMDNPGSYSTANLTFEISINDAVTGDLVFNWAPNGMTALGTGGILGGIASSDPFSLNTGLTAFTGEQAVYSRCDPNNPNSNCFFEASATGLGSGSRYNFEVAMVEFAQGAQKVPLPPTLVLMGVGLLGFGVVSRRRLLG